MKRLVLAIAAVAAFGVVASPALAHKRDATYYVSHNKKQHVKVSFYVADGKVRKTLLDAHRVPCTQPDAMGTVTRLLPSADLEGSIFKAKYRAHFDRLVVRGSVTSGTANARQIDRNRDCHSGPLRWHSKKVSHKEWNAFRGPFATPSSKRNQPGTTYYYGKGDAKKSDVTFAVSDGKVRKALAGTGKVECSPMGHSRIFKAWGGAEIKGHAFKNKTGESGEKFVFAGRIYGAAANGRMLGRYVEPGGNVCDSGAVRWAAHRVSKDEWKQHRHGYQVSPSN